MSDDIVLILHICNMTYLKEFWKITMKPTDQNDTFMLSILIDKRYLFP